MYDIIGDIHGHADELAALLEQMGYEQRDGCYRHTDRQAVFVGDLIDRGPKIPRTVHIVRSMVEAGAARMVMGNHEFNAIAYHTPHPDQPGRYLRKHIEKNNTQHGETLRQFSGDELANHIYWFRGLPLWLELDGFRVVHACWDPESMRVIERGLKEHGGLTFGFMQAATDGNSPLFDATETVLKGKEVPLPDGLTMLDKDGHPRPHVRVQWFASPDGRSLREYAFPPSDLVPDVPPPAVCETNHYAADAPPVFFGHYWLTDARPRVLASNVGCVDFSVAKNGYLCAYRWDGERELRDEKFVWTQS